MCVVVVEDVATYFVFLWSVCGLAEPRALYVLAKHSASEPQPVRVVLHSSVYSDLSGQPRGTNISLQI